ncbi:transposase, partial [Dehalococcoidia bacterium]|nr:transposase [Dehalococcoidia bacterium]
SDSPWSAGAVFDQIQAEVRQRPELRGGMLTLDESGDKKAGNQSAGVARQYLGRLGKVDLGQMGVALGYYQAAVWMMVDAELYLPEEWFDQFIGYSSPPRCAPHHWIRGRCLECHVKARWGE